MARLNAKTLLKIMDSEGLGTAQVARMLERPIVGIQTHASCPQRSYPAGHVLRLMELLQADSKIVDGSWVDALVLYDKTFETNELNHNEF